MCGAHVYINSLRMEAASFAFTLYLLTAFEGHRELHLQPEPQLRNAESTGKMKRWKDTSHSPEDHRGENPAELACDSAFSQWTLMKPYRILEESWDFDNTFSSPPAAAKAYAFCFECLVATSPYLIPWVYNCSLACTCPKLPRAVLSSPNCLFFPSRSPIPTDCLFTWWWSLWTCSVFIYSLRDSLLQTPAYFSFLPHSFNCFLRVMPAPIYPWTLPLTPRSDPPAQDWSWEMACSEHCGVLRTAWSNVDEAWGSPVGGRRPELLSDVSLSAQRFSAFNLRILQYTVYFLFVATNERGPGGMKQITGVEGREKVRRQMPWAGPPPPRTREESCSPNWLFRIVESHISFYVRCKCSVDFS